MAAMKLPDAPNYRWQTEVVDDARSYEIVGETDRATDYSLVTMPVAGPGRGRGSRGGAPVANNTTMLFKGSERSVVQSDDGWRRPEDLSASGRGRDGRGSYGGSPGGFGGPGGSGSRSRGRYPGSDGTREPPARSNLQNTLSRPHEEIAIIIAANTELKVDGYIVSGALTETAAALLLVHDGQKDITPRSASGTFRFWVRDGALVKYEVKLEGKLTVETLAGRRDVVVHQTSTTTLSKVGTTKVEVPEAAKKLLGA